jgi:transposase
MRKFNSCCLEKQKEIDRLKEENRSLKEKLKRLEQQTKDGYFGLSTPSSKKPFKENSKGKKNGGAKIGHIGHGRKKVDEEDATRIKVPLSEICPDCKNKTEHKGIVARGIIDGKMPTTEKVIYDCEKRYCPKCKKTFLGQPPVLPRTLYGNGLLSMIATMYYFEGVPLNRIIEMLGLADIKKGSIINALHRVSGFFAPVVAKIIEDYRSTPVRHADETGWRTDGDSGYAWLFCSKTESIFEFANTRSGQVPLRILGAEKLNGYLITDRYAGYNSIQCEKQFCLAHLLRDIKGIKESYEDKDLEVTNFTNLSLELLADIMKLNQTYKSDEAYYKNAKRLEAELKKVMSAPSHNPNVKEIQHIFLKNENKLYQWVKDRRVPAENNRAERELRPTVVARKVSFGSQSPEGSKTRSIFMTILHTTKKRLSEQSVADWLKNVLDKISLDNNIDIVTLLPQKQD